MAESEIRRRKALDAWTMMPKSIWFQAALARLGYCYNMSRLRLAKKGA